MKTHHSIIAILLATTLLATAKEPTPATPRRPAIPSSETASPHTVPSPSGPKLEEQSNALAANYQITIAGSLGKTEPFDVTLRGNSPIFLANLPDPTRSIEVRLLNEKDPLKVVYSIDAVIPVKTGENSVQYRDVRVRGSFLATLGQAFPILQIGDSKLTIQVDKIAEKK